MAIGGKGLQAFKSAGSPPMPVPPAPALPPAPKPPAAAGPGTAAAVTKAAAEVQAGEVDPQVEQLVAEADPTTGTPPPSAADVDLWAHCLELVDPQGAGATKFGDVDPMMVVAQLYADLGGEIDAGEATEPEEFGHPEPDGDEEVG